MGRESGRQCCQMAVGVKRCGGCGGSWPSASDGRRSRYDDVEKKADSDIGGGGVMGKIRRTKKELGPGPVLLGGGKRKGAPHEVLVEALAEGGARTDSMFGG